MHWRDCPECQGCTGSTSFTCVHSAVARNSLTYLTALETPDRGKTDTRIKAGLQAHSQPREDTNRACSWALGQRQEAQGAGQLCQALFGLCTQVTLPSPLWAQTTAFRVLGMGSHLNPQNPGGRGRKRVLPGSSSGTSCPGTTASPYLLCRGKRFPKT